MSEDRVKRLMKEHLDDTVCPLAFDEVWEKAKGKSVKKSLFRLRRLRPVVAFAAALILMVGVGATVMYELRRDDVSYQFKNDKDLVGTWKTIDLVNQIEDFEPDEQNWEGGLYLRGIEFKEKGTTKFFAQEMNEDMFQVEEPSSWSKGYVNNYINETKSTYRIKEIEGKEYLFFEWKSPDYTYSLLDYVPQYVLERGVPTERDLQKELEGRKVDDISYNFVEDPEVLGAWKIVGFVEHKEDYNPKEKQSKKDEWLTGITFKENGSLAYNIRWKQGPVISKQWTKGCIVDRENRRRSAYEIVEIDGKEYLFFEAKEEDYVYGRIDDVPYYVFERVE